MKKLGYFIVVMVLLSVTLVACGGEEATQPPAAAQTKTVILGFTSSKTGAQEVPSSGQPRGLELWLEQVNAKGITLADGTVVKFEFKTYDDESNKDRVQQLYTKLINDDKTNFLISPYSSGLNEWPRSSPSSTARS